MNHTQQELPETYRRMSTAELTSRIAECKRRLGTALCILGHHYQRDEVIQFADVTGDSLKLSQYAAERKDARYIVFCGVHFMAESADILSTPEQTVILPNLRAGCGMAEMANEATVAKAMEEVMALAGGKVVPVTYVNSTAAIKALTARHGGACCTSSNVRNVFAWALVPTAGGGAGAEKIFAIPDQHLGRNTAVAMGYAEDDCVMYNTARPNGGLSAEQVRKAKFILWNGFCDVHQLFRPHHVTVVRLRHPGIRVIVHPECSRQVVALGDQAGSTEQTIGAVEAAPPGSSWAIGTESNMVSRLASRNPDRLVRLLADSPVICRQMYLIDLPHLAWVLDNLVAGQVVNQVSVPADVAEQARVALRRMIEIKAAM